MSEQPEIWGWIFETLVKGSKAWQGPAEVADGIGLDLDSTTDILADMNVAGWVDVWELEHCLAVTLSSLAAERLGVRLEETGLDEEARWHSVGDPVPSPPRAKNVCSSIRGADWNFLIDPAVSPEEIAELAEEAAEFHLTEEGPSLPFPMLLLGTNLTPWPGPDLELSETCPACGARPLPKHAYCLCCDRWGFDDFPGVTVPNARRSAQRAGNRTRTPSNSSRPANLDNPDRDRSRRKARRKTKMAARIELNRCKTQARYVDPSR